MKILKDLGHSQNGSGNEEASEAAQKLLNGLMEGQKPVIKEEKSKRGLLDGCFDLVHAGHINAIRQGHAIAGENLVIAVISDKAVEAVKGPTVLKIDERRKIVESLKWATNVVVVDKYYVDEELLDEQNCQFYIHGDDPVLDAEGNNTVDLLTNKNRFQVIQRLTGVSTTDITGKLLNLIAKFKEESSPLA